MEEVSEDRATRLEVLDEEEDLDLASLESSRRGSAGRPAGQHRAHRRDQARRLGHPHRALREGLPRPLPDRRHPLRDDAAAAASCARRSPAGSRSWPSSTSPRSACRRTAASRSRPRSQGKVKDLDFRVSVLPTIFGEKIVMRLLDKDNLMLDMTRLGFEAESLRRFEHAILKPYGMVLVTGPTGSGKTNTLYSALSAHQHPGGQHHHRRGPGRVQPRRASTRCR